MTRKHKKDRAITDAARNATPFGLLRRSSESEVTAEDLVTAAARIAEYAKPYQECLGRRREYREHLLRMFRGLTSDLERKSVEPIAVMHDIPRRGLQRFVGERGWDWESLRSQMLEEVKLEIGIPDGTLIVDGSATPKKGEETVGVARQWCGRLGKVENCVVGLYAAYVGKHDLAALVGAELFLPEEWTTDRVRREEAYVPEKMKYRSQPRVAGDLIKKLATKLPFTWVLGDDEFGRAKHFRDAVAVLDKSYVLDVPSNTIVRRVNKHGHILDKSWSIKKLTRRCGVDQWHYFYVRDGEKGPIEKRALMLSVATMREATKDQPRHWVQEKLIVIEELDASQRSYCLAHADPSTTLAEFVKRQGQRHRIEEVFEEAKGEVGLDHFEVRAWHGWYHHMTLSQISHWFLVREKRRLGKKSSRHHDQPNPDGHCRAPGASTNPRTTCCKNQLPPSSKQASSCCSIQNAAVAHA